MNKFSQKAFLQFFFPSVLVGTGLAFSNIIDSLVVGQQLGEPGLAAIGFTCPVFMLLAAIYVCISVGSSVQFSKLLGNNEFEEAEQLASIMIELCIIIGVAIAIIGYIFTPQIVILLGASRTNLEVYNLTITYCRILMLTAPALFLNSTLYYLIRSDNHEKFAGYSYLIGTITDVVLNLFLVTVLKMGIEGSAYATLIGQHVSVIVLLFHLRHKDRVIKVKFYPLNSKKIVSCLRIGFASSNQYVSQCLFIIIINHIIIGLVGDSGIAVFDVILNVSYIALLFFTAASDSLIPLASTLFGERNIPELKKIFKFSIHIGFILGTILLIAIAVFAGPLCRFFGITSPDTIALGIHATRIYCSSGFLAGFSLIISSYYQSTDREKMTLVITILRGAIFLIGFTLLFSLTNGYYFWFLFPLTEIFSLIAVFVLHRFKVFGSTTIPAAERFYTVLFNHTLDNLGTAMSEVEALNDKFEISMKQSMYIMNALEEMCVAIRDNTPIDDGKQNDFYIIVTIVYEEDGSVRLCIRDNAKEYNPFSLGDKRMDADSMDDLNVISGLGIMMVKNKAKDFNYRRYLNFNTMIVVI